MMFDRSTKQASLSCHSLQKGVGPTMQCCRIDPLNCCAPVGHVIFLHPHLVSVLHHLSDTKRCMSMSTGSAINRFRDDLMRVTGTSTSRMTFEIFFLLPVPNSSCLVVGLQQGNCCWRWVSSSDSSSDLVVRHQLLKPISQGQTWRSWQSTCFKIEHGGWRRRTTSPIPLIFWYSVKPMHAFAAFAPLSTFTIATLTCPAVTSFLVPAFAWMFPLPPRTPGIRVAFLRAVLPTVFALSLPSFLCRFFILLSAFRYHVSNLTAVVAFPRKASLAQPIQLSGFTGRTVRLQRRCCAARKNPLHQKFHYLSETFGGHPKPWELVHLTLHSSHHRTKDHDVLAPGPCCFLVLACTSGSGCSSVACHAAALRASIALLQRLGQPRELLFPWILRSPWSKPPIFPLQLWHPWCSVLVQDWKLDQPTLEVVAQTSTATLASDATTHEHLEAASRPWRFSRGWARHQHSLMTLPETVDESTTSSCPGRRKFFAGALVWWPRLALQQASRHNPSPCHPQGIVELPRILFFELPPYSGMLENARLAVMGISFSSEPFELKFRIWASTALRRKSSS